MVLLIGGRLDFRGGFARGYSKDSKWIQVGIEADGIGHIREAEVGIVGDAKAVLKQTMEEALDGHGEFVKKPEDIRPALERAFASGLPACVNVMTGLAPS